jgi:hypothetical protein
VRALLLLPALALAACGGSSSTSSHADAAQHAASTANPQPAVSELAAAERPRPDQFPAPAGRSLKQLAQIVHATAQLGAATGTYTPGRRRFAFALANSAQRYIYAPTAVYIAATPNSLAEGPFLAPADPMGVAPQYRSKQNSAPGGLEAIYRSEVPVRRSGIYDVLALTRVGSQLVGSTAEIAVALSTPIPDVGQRPPPVATDTPASVHGDLALLTTRQPPESMHSVSFNQVLGKRPIALLFSTPQLCTSRVCGPVTDIVVSLQHQFANRIAFIHEEVYVDNQPSRGLRPQLQPFHLETEPWLFTINRQGIITARLEGAFGIDEARAALQAALS